MRFTIFTFTFLLFIILFTPETAATENPTNVPNNKFGIHIIDENDLDMAQSLVNSSGGDWGYVTIVVREDEKDRNRWQEVLDKMRRKHLIPIIRIATTQTTDGWIKPRNEDIDNWIDFLNSLNWVIKNRYVIIGNEPNQSHEWGGELKPDEYAKYLLEFSKKLKERSSDFFVLQAGFDASAPNSRTTMTEKKYIENMLKQDPNVFNYIDGWTSHSYPKEDLQINKQYGQGSLRSYLWEMDLLKSLGINKKLPIFITETGFKHDGSGSLVNNDSYTQVFTDIWNDEDIVAVTPFLLSYKADPFLKFSWLDKNGNPYQFFNDVKSLIKISGEPVQINDGSIDGGAASPLVQAGHGIYGFMAVRNSGQSIWKDSEVILNGGKLFPYQDIEPFQSRILFFKISAPDMSGVIPVKLQLTRNGKSFGNSYDVYTRVFTIFSPFKFLNLGV